jgi:hypothetical protein
MFASTRNESFTSAAPGLEKECYVYEVERNDTEFSQHMQKPNIALLSLMLLIGTCCIALTLKKLRRSVFLGARVINQFFVED